MVPRGSVRLGPLALGLALGAGVAGAAGTEVPAHYWPFKNGNLNRTGLSPYSATFRVESPTWVFEEPDRLLKRGAPFRVFHSSPVIDAERNTYITSSTGWVYSLAPDGALRWSTELLGEQAGVAALLGGRLFTCTAAGWASALEMATGEVLWQRKIGESCGADTFSTVAIGDTVLLPATPEDWYPEAHNADYRAPWCGTEQLVALSASDGSVRWRYDVSRRSRAILYNVMPAVVGNAVVFADYSGGLYKVGLEDGHEIWYYPPPKNDTWSTGGMVVGPNNKVYVAFNQDNWMYCNGYDGILRVHDLHTGRPLWNRTFGVGVNAAPAVGPVAPDGRLAVVVAVGNNLSPYPVTWSEKPKELMLLHSELSRSPVVALDAETGEDLWSFELRAPRMSTAGVDGSDLCAPDVFGNPAIGADGTVYQGWSGGKFFALRDANGDGRINPKDPSEVSEFVHGGGANGAAAMAPGLLVSPSCWKLLGYVA